MQLTQRQIIPGVLTSFQWFSKRNQDSATWMKALPEEDRLGGFRCNELPVEAVLLRWHLLGLNPMDAANVAFAEWRAELAKLSPEERAAALQLQDEAFRRTTKEVQCKHHYRYLTLLLLPCAIFHPNRKLGVALCAALLAAHDGIAAPEIPVGEVVHLQGKDVYLARLLTDLTQHIRKPGQDVKKYAVFNKPDVVAALRGWVAAEGDF